MDAITTRMYNPQQGHSALADLWRHAKAHLVAGRQLEVELRERRRSSPQNRKLHACIADVSRQVTWAGQRWAVDDMKRLLVAAWVRARGGSATMVPSLDGHGFDVIYQRTSDLSKSDCAELLEYVMAWGTTQGVKWSDPELEPLT